MTQNEIKPSFTGKYIFLILITSVIIAGVSFGVEKLSKSKPIRQLVVYESKLLNMISSSALANSQIEATYYLNGNSKKQVKSLFRKTVIIKNTGNEGVENLSIMFSVKGRDAFLISSPKIESSPYSILEAINLTKVSEISSDKKHLWNVPLLNASESLTFEYNIYSEKELDDVIFTAVPRKKDWNVSRENILSSKITNTLFPSFMSGVASLGVLFPIVLLLFYKLMRPVYRKEWDANSEIREKYGSYDQYFNKHFPPPIIRYFISE